MRRGWAWANAGKVRQGPRPRRQNLANETAFLFSGHNEATLRSQVNSRGPCSAIAMCLERPVCPCASHSSALESCVTWGNSLNLSVPRARTILQRWASPPGQRRQYWHCHAGGCAADHMTSHTRCLQDWLALASHCRHCYLHDPSERNLPLSDEVPTPSLSSCRW